MFSNRISSATGPNAFSAKVSELRRSGIELLNLSESNPTRCGLEFPGLLESLASPGCRSYDPDPRGLPAARQLLSERTGTHPDDIFLSASTSEAYSWLFKLLCDPGDFVLVPKPGYPLFDYLAALEGLSTLPYRLEYSHPDGFRIDIDDLADSFKNRRVKAIVLIHPNNPSGSYVRDSERRAIVDLCEKFGVAIIADEVFMPYEVDAEQRQASFNNERRCLTFTLDGLSKLLCLPQLKLGWLQISGPADLKKQASLRLEIIADTYLSVGCAPVHALARLLPQADDFIRALQARLRANLATLRAGFQYGASPYRVYRCEGGWTSLLEVPRILPEEALILDLLEYCKIMVHPGYFFDFEDEGILSLSLILQPDVFKSGIARLKTRLDTLVGF